MVGLHTLQLLVVQRFLKELKRDATDLHVTMRDHFQIEPLTGQRLREQKIQVHVGYSTETSVLKLLQGQPKLHVHVCCHANLWQYMYYRSVRREDKKSHGIAARKVSNQANMTVKYIIAL